VAKEQLKEIAEHMLHFAADKTAAYRVVLQREAAAKETPPKSSNVQAGEKEKKASTGPQEKRRPAETSAETSWSGIPSLPEPALSDGKLARGHEVSSVVLLERLDKYFQNEIGK